MFPCPCCGYNVFSEPPGSYDICPICYWEDDIVQIGFPDLAGGANGCSLIDGQKNYEQNGVCEGKMSAFVRQPNDSDLRDPSWRPLDPEVDPYLRWLCEADHQRWQAVKDVSNVCLYYWLPKYWLRS